MSQILANLSPSLPLSSIETFIHHSRNPFAVSCIPTHNAKNKNNSFKLKAISAGGRNNLDHLQRSNNISKQQQQQQQQVQQPKRRVAPSAPIGLWDRFPTARTVQQMMETMDRMMDDPFVYSGGSPVEESRSGGYSRGRTPWEIKEGESEYKMRFDMPGMTKEDVKVWVEEKMLVVKGEKVAKKKVENSNGGVVEEEEGEGEWSAKSYGRYSFRIALPENIEFEKIKAEVKDGILYIDIPKAISKSKILDINVR